jgi:hypothetical protein
MVDAARQGKSAVASTIANLTPTEVRVVKVALHSENTVYCGGTAIREVDLRVIPDCQIFDAGRDLISRTN